jgi:hypothetical protein
MGLSKNLFLEFEALGDTDKGFVKVIDFGIELG